MTQTNLFLAVFLGNKESAKAKAWFALPEAERKAKEQQGIAAWKAWAEKHQAAIANMGGPASEQDYADFAAKFKGRLSEDQITTSVEWHRGLGGKA